MRRYLTTTAVALTFAAGFSGLAIAQEGEPTEQIKVTAQLREQTLQETPVAVAVVQDETIDQSVIRDVRDLQVLVPSLRIAQFSRPGVTEFSIRGLGTSADNVGLEPSVGIFVDGVYRTRQGAAINDFLSLERVEVLRGPQSTLFGRNTPAGVVSFITKKPTYDWEAVGEVAFGDYDQRVVKGTVSGPLVDETLAFRLDAVRNIRDGFIDNIATGEAVNDRDRYDFRGQLLFEPNDDVTFRLIGDIGQADEACCAAPFSFHLPQNLAALEFLGATIASTDPFDREVAFDSTMRTVVDTSGFSGQLDWELDNGMTFTSITAFREYSDESDIDADFTDLELASRRLFNSSDETFTQEVRLASDTDGPFSWLVGGFYLDQALESQVQQPYGEDLRAFTDLASGGAVTALESGLGFPPGTFFASGTGLQNELNNINVSSWSIFGQGDWQVNDRLTITAGARYTEEEKDIVADITIVDPFSALDFVEIGFQQIFAATFTALTGLPPTPENIAANPSAAAAAQANAAAGSTDPTVNTLLGLTPLQFNPPASDYARARSEDNVSGNIILSYQLQDNLNVYGSWSRGFKAGGFNVSAFAALTNAFEFDAEIATNWEFGAKGSLNNGAFNYNMAVFDTTLEDFQANTFTGTAFVLDNAGQVSVGGLEFESLWQATPGLLLTGGFTYLWTAEYDEYLNAPCSDLDTSSSCLINNTQDISGRQLSGASNTTISTTATYTYPIGNALEGVLRGELFYASDRNLGSDLDPRKEEGEFFITNAGAGIGADDGSWELYLYGKNLLDEEYLQGAFSSVGQPGSLNAYPGDPRTWGVLLRVRR